MRFSSPAFSSWSMKSRRSRYRIANSRPLLALHGEEEFVVGFEVLELASQKFAWRHIFHVVKKFAQNPCALQFVFCHQQIFTPGSGAANINGRVDASLSDFAIKVQLEVTGTFKLFVDYL